MTARERTGRRRVSVVVAAHNEQARIGRCLTSLLDVMGPDDELVVVDDGSTDATPTEVAAIDDGRLTSVRLDRRHGRGAARNAGLRVAKGEFVAIQDADDIALPGRLSALVTELVANPRAVAVSGQCVTVTSAGRPWRHATYPTSSDEAARTLHRGAMPLCHPATLLRRSAVEAIGGYDERYTRAQDLEMVLRIARLGEVYAVPHAVLLYRHDVVLPWPVWMSTRRFAREALGTVHPDAGLTDRARYVVSMCRRALRFARTTRSAAAELERCRP